MAGELRFELDEANVEHMARHSVRPEEVEQALLNDSFDYAYEVMNREERWTSIGHTHAVRVLLVVWTLRGVGPAIRVVTAS